MFLSFDDVPGFTADDAWRIEDVESMALLAAPCLGDTLTEIQTKQVRAVLRTALIRMKDEGSGSVQQTTAGPFGQTIDTRQPRRGLFWPSELAELRSICALATGASSGTAGTLYVNTLIHAAWCSLNLGATFCSCGADIAGVPIFEQPEVEP